VVWLYFKQKDPVSSIPTLLSLLFVAPVASVGFEWHFYPSEKIAFGTSWLQPFFSFHAVLLSCVIAYRLSPLHPLYRYPGPLVCKISKLWIMWLAHKGKLHVYYKNLHDTYGPIVRIGEESI